jgi:hypothetical protein
MKVHLWKAYNIKKISVDLRPEFKNKLRELILGQIPQIANSLKILPVRLYEYFIYQKSPIPLRVLMNLIKLIRISSLELEENIILYKQMFVPMKNSVKNPKLPLTITPYFTSIISNLYFDGSLPKDGKGTYYNQKRKEIMQGFIERVKFVFGDVHYVLRKDHRDVLKCRLPRVVGEICKKIYEVDSFGCFDSKISKKIFSLSKDHKIAFVLTAILDEGSIAYDGTIMFGVTNKDLCEGVKILCNQIGLVTNNLRNKKNSDFHYFHIKSRKNFYKIIKSFSKKYPLISLNYKEKRLKIALEIKKQKVYHTKDFASKRIKLILQELKKGNCSINYLASKHLIPPRTVRRYMYKLMKERKVKREKIGNEYYYTISNSKFIKSIF